MTKKTADDRRALLTEIRRGERATITVAECSLLLEVGRNQCYAAVHRGEIPSVTLGKRVLIPAAALLAILDGGKRQPC